MSRRALPSAQFRSALFRSALLLAGFTTSVAPAQDLGPILLRDSLLLSPLEASGSDLAPEVKVRVTIDARGRVTVAEVESVTPSTEYDAAIRESVESELRSWRYAPALEGGVPVEATLDWIVQLQPRRAESVGGIAPEQPSLPPSIVRMRVLAAQQASLLALPREAREKILVNYSKTAETYISSATRSEASSPRFLVVTDSTVPKLAEIVAGNLEASLHAVGRVLEPAIEPYPNDLKVLVYLYSSRGAYYSMRQQLIGEGGQNATYLAPGILVSHLDMPSETLLSMLIHEATHAYSDRMLARPGRAFPRWMEEGFAEYMGNSTVRKGELIPGKSTRREFVMAHGEVVNRTTGTGWDLEGVKKAIRTQQGLTLEEVVSSDPSTFYGDRASLYYGTSWLLVHYLRHGDPAWEKENFPTLVLYLAEGYPGVEALAASHRRPLAELEEGFIEYVRKF